MVLASAAVHVIIVALAIAIPYSLHDDAPKLVSYSVDLVAPDRLGGTNIPANPKLPPKLDAPAAGPPPVVAKEPEPPKPVEKKEEAPPPPPPKEEAKVEPPKPKEEAKLPEPPKPKEEVKPKEQPKDKPAPVKVSAKKEEKPKAPPAKEAKPADKAEKKTDAKQPPANKEDAKPEVSAKESAEQIAAKLREERIAAAVKRAGSQAKPPESTGNGVGAGGGPASIGPGEGIGGQAKGLEWIMYKNRVEGLIRDNWIWTGSDHSLETTVTFGITESGEITNFQIQTPSGDPSYDASIERAIKSVSPLPPPPEAYRTEFSQYELTFNAEFLQM